MLMNTSRVKVIIRSMSQGRASSRAMNMQTILGTEFNGLAAETDDEIRRHLAALLGSES